MSASEQLPLSERQREIMEVVWNNGEVSVFEVRAILAEQGDIARNTVRTLMERMENKGWLSHRVIGRTYFYSALVPRELSLGRRVLEIVDKSCGGAPEKLMAALLEHRGLTNEEAERIRAMLDDARKQKKNTKGKRS